MHLYRKYDLSVYFYMKGIFENTQINVVDGFPDGDLVIPTISVEYKTLDPKLFELGNRNRLAIETWYIDVFAQNKSQRDEIGFTILDSLEECIPVYDYDLGFPPTVVPQLGCLDIKKIRMDFIRIYPEMVSKMYYRCTISFTASFNQI